MRRLALVALLHLGCFAAPATSAAQDAGVVDHVRSLYQDLRYDEAERRALQAIDHADVYDVGELADLHALLALIYFVQQNETRARSEFLTALSLNADLVLDPVLVPPRALTFFDAIREEVARDAGAAIDPSRRYIVLMDLRPGAAMRSALLPGWGQRYKGEDAKGWVLSALFVGTAGAALAVHLASDDADSPALPQDESDSGSVAGDVLLGAAAGVWLYAYLDALLRDTPRKRPAPGRIQMQLAPTASGLRVGGLVRF